MKLDVLKEIVANEVDLPRLEIGLITGGAFQTAHVIKYWVAEIDHSGKAVLYPYVVATTLWEKGGLLIVPRQLLEVESRSLIPPFSLENWQDPVEEVLQTIGIFPKKQTGFGIGGYAIDVMLAYATMGFSSTMRFSNSPLDMYDGFKALWNSFIKTIRYYLVSRNYQDSELFLQDLPGYEWG